MTFLSKQQRRFVIIVAVILLTMPVSVTHAAIVPCGETIDTLCTPCDVFSLISNIINYIFIIVPVVAGAFFVYAGFLLLLGGAKPELVKKASGIFTNTIVGILIIFTSWMLANFFIKTLAGDSDSATSWFRIECTGGTGSDTGDGGGGPGPVSSPGPSGGGTTSGVPYGTTSDVEPGGSGDIPPSSQGIEDAEAGHNDAPASGTLPAGDAPLTSAQARAQLTAAGIGAKPECAPGASRGCAKLEGVRQSTINEVIELKQRCPSCNVYVTAGAEPGHSNGTYSHANGFKVDLSSKDGTVDNHVRTSGDFQHVGRRSSDGALLYKKKSDPSVIYARESDHWDVSVKPR